MFRRYLLNLPLYSIPPGDTGSGGGSTENGAVSGASGTSVESGVASPELIAAASASESSTEESGSSHSAAEALARAAGEAENPLLVDGVVKPATTGAAKVSSPATGTETGPVPQDRHIAAVRNARQAGIDEATKDYAWAKGTTQEAVGTAFTIVREILTDPKAFVTKLAAESGMQVVPIGTTVPAQAAATGGAGKSWKDGIPKGQLHAEDGTEAFSREQVVSVLESAIGALREELTGQIEPLLTGEEKRAEDARTAGIANQARTDAATHMTELRKLPHFQVKDASGVLQDSPKIGAYLMQIPQAERVKNPVAAFYKAYNTYMEKDVLPTLTGTAAQQVRDENSRKAASSVGAHPAGAGRTGVVAPIKNTSDLARRMQDMAEGRVAVSGA